VQPVCEIIIQVFDTLYAQEMDDTWVFFLCFLDAAALQAPVQDQDNVEPVLGRCHGHKDGSDLEKDPGFRRSDYNLAAAQDEFSKTVVQLDNFWRVAIEKLLDGELAARMGLVAILE
jgi:hypothetical protein